MPSIKQLLILIMAMIMLMTGFTSAETVNGKYLGDGRDRYNLFVFGDALAGGLWAGLSRMSKGNPRLKINGRYHEGSGFARPEIYAWPEKLPKLLKSQRVDIAVFFIGSNDIQSIRQNGEILTFDSPEWKQAYADRVGEIMTLLKQSNAAIYWIELPPVSDSELDRKYKIVSAIQRQVAQKNSVRFLSFRKQFTSPDGEYIRDGIGVDGYELRLRTYNGERFIKDGNNKLASLLLQKLALDIEIADGERATSQYPAPTATKASTKVGVSKSASKPEFGLSLLDGKAFIVPQSSLPSSVISSIITSNGDIPVFGSNSQIASLKQKQDPDSALKMLRETSSKNGPAHKLFFNGIWPESKSGRIDDFSVSVRQP